ncbi:hypothetical protein EVAR_52808_1 [Eumeta japonica]|uniref:Uncharacterized protein n=1 Tax=Eumeta variegata TaxID=151549 RepID=A0A4C1Y7D5_EUMVA|nr:hypothetical protein EVAR_52808_1 [Eumeta japonica]
MRTLRSSKPPQRDSVVDTDPARRRAIREHENVQCEDSLLSATLRLCYDEEDRSKNKEGVFCMTQVRNSLASFSVVRIQKRDLQVRRQRPRPLS